MRLYFKNNQGLELSLAKCETVKEAHKEISKFLEQKDDELEEKYHQITMDEYLESLQKDGE